VRDVVEHDDGHRGEPLTVGGGVRLRVHRYLALTLGEADWALSKATNNNSDKQNNLRVTTGVVFLFGPR